MTRTQFILVPSAHPTGPVKGAYAIANALVARKKTILVFLKRGPGVDAFLDDRVIKVFLDEYGTSFTRKLNAYKALLIEEGGRSRVDSLSLCFSADIVNLFCRKQAVIYSSVRGNLFQNYRYDYGRKGLFLAVVHLVSLSHFDEVVAMTNVMARQIKRVTRRMPKVIGNFVDEQSIEPYRVTPRSIGKTTRFVFVGSLSKRKRPELVLEAMVFLDKQKFELDILGDGPEFGALKKLIYQNGLQRNVRLHGHLSNPLPIVAGSDVFVLPSNSEGVSRAAIEALYLGIPCVLRNVDGNRSLLSEPESGAVFDQDSDLLSAMLDSVQMARRRIKRESLLPQCFRESHAVFNYVALLGGDS